MGSAWLITGDGLDKIGIRRTGPRACPLKDHCQWCRVIDGGGAVPSPKPKLNYLPRYLMVVLADVVRDAWLVPRLGSSATIER